MELPPNTTLKGLLIMWLLLHPGGRIIVADANEHGEVDPRSIEEPWPPSRSN
jgi:hypothetical protein